MQLCRDSYLVLILVANIAVNMGMFASVLDNSLPFQYTDLVVRFFFAISLGRRVCMCATYRLVFRFTIVQRSQWYMNIVFLIYLRFI
jgi:hypothetical protein